jgi:hypothetical protein
MGAVSGTRLAEEGRKRSKQGGGIARLAWVGRRSKPTVLNFESAEAASNEG